jgi:putative endonuclease
MPSVYILSSLSRTLYVGVTRDLPKRVAMHRAGTYGGFTHRYRVNRLVYYEVTTNIRSAIEREKEIKGWSRNRKIELIESVNAGWEDLAADTLGPLSP